MSSQTITAANGTTYTVEGEELAIVNAAGQSARTRVMAPHKMPETFVRALRSQGHNPADYLFVGRPVHKDAAPLVDLIVTRREAAHAARPGAAIEEARGRLEDAIEARRLAGESEDGCVGVKVGEIDRLEAEVERLEEADPRGVLQLKAESYSRADYDVKAAAGRNALAAIEAGRYAEADALLANWIVGSSVD